MEDLVVLSDTKRAVMHAHSVVDCNRLVKMAQAVQAVADTDEMRRKASELYLRARRRRGEIERGLPKAKGTRGQLAGKDSSGTPKFGEPEDSASTQAERYADPKHDPVVDAKLVDIPQGAFEEYVSTSEDITTAGALRIAETPHVTHNSGDNEWYTPRVYVDAARDVLGGIDLDPASNKEANAVVKADTFYTAEDDGLSHEWRGRVWMNPPYASGLVERFIDKLLSEWRSNNIPAAIVLTNNATETRWWQELSEHASAVCFVKKRIRYWKPGNDGEATGLQGQSIMYLGDAVARFLKGFGELGACWPHE